MCVPLRIATVVLSLGASFGCATRTALPIGGVSQEEPQRAAQESTPDSVPAYSLPPRYLKLSDLVRLMDAVEHSPGCQGTVRAVTTNGRLVLFSWFENKQALLQWYHSQMHQGLLGQSPDSPHQEPLSYLDENTGPILVITSITPIAGARLLFGELPLSQIAIELYAPLPGGHFIGNRFAPPPVQIPHSIDIGQ